jgi:cellulose synthase/poly-beta-1,6-N-acetylglucosamine synthase-like glycosyltransferase
MLLQYLFLSMTGFLISTVFMVTFGHKVKTGHWLLSLLYLSEVLYGSYWIVDNVIGQVVDPQLILLASVPGLLIIAYAKNWNLFGQINYALTLQAAVAFVGYAGYVVFTSDHGVASLGLSIILLVLVVCAMALMLAHTFELVDVACRRQWRRIKVPTPTTNYFPKVSLHVPAHNEPPEMVIATLNALANIDYPNYEVLMIDDNTTDASLWRPVELHCRKLGFKFYHLENWPGFKSGALNFATTKTDPEAEIIGIVDSDYIVEPNYLRELVGFFEEDNVAFVQTPQDYRDFNRQDRYLLACYHAYQYFFKLSMASRNERNGIIFTGTMGLIRKNVLQSVGGWDEWCITEDAEISLKILNLGYESIFIDKTYGRGLMPLNFESLKKQRFRWAFGGMQVLRLHWKKLLPWSRNINAENRLTPGQKFDYWSGGLQWFNDPITFLFTAILLLNGISYSVTHTAFLEPLAGAALFVPFLLIIFSLTRTLWGLRLRLNCTTLEAFRALLVLLSLTWVVTLACFFGLTRKAGVFLRTSKKKENCSLVRHLKIINTELSIAALCSLMVVWLLSTGHLTATVWLLSGLLLWQIFIYSSAVIVSRWSYESEAHSAGIKPSGLSSALIKPPLRIAAKSTAVAAIAGISLTFHQSQSNTVDKDEAISDNPSSSQVLLRNAQNVESDPVLEKI